MKEKKRIGIDDVLGEVEKPIMNFEDADRKHQESKKEEINKGGRPIKGSGKATNKVAFHIDDEAWQKLESMIDFPKEKSVNAVCKRLVEAMIIAR